MSGRLDSSWEQRFRAPDLNLPVWGRHAPERLAVGTNESGSWQIHAWDRAAGTRRRVTDNPIGVLADEDVTYLPTPDGRRIVWFDDPTGDETARWMVVPFDAAPDGRVAAQPFLPGVPDAWTTGIAIGDSIVAVGTGRPEGFDVYVSVDGAPARSIHHHAEIVAMADLSLDESLLAIEHAEHGDSVHFALRIVRPATGETVAELWDGPGLGLHAAGWSPVAGDQRLAIVHERGGRHRPGIWDLATGERTDIDIDRDLPGDVTVLDWWPDASALLLLHEFDGRSELYRLTLTGEGLSRIEHPTGTVSAASVRPDGAVWYRHAAGDRSPEVRTTDGGGTVLALEGEAAPPGRPFESWSFTNPNGDRVHGFYVTPPGDGPFPVIMDVHGGPTWAYADDFRPSAQAWVDHGFAVGMVNYRGSTGYGSEFRDALLGNPGFPETEDVLTGLDDLIARGIADPARAVVGGNSWGGYITLMSLGLHPDRYALGLAGVPVADYPAAYEDEAELLRAYDRTLFGGGGLEDMPELYAERSPMTYIENVRAPVLILAGDNDSRCPIRQIINYCERLTELGREFELYRFEAGHGSMVMNEQIRQMRLRLDYALARIDASAVVGGERA